MSRLYFASYYRWLVIQRLFGLPHLTPPPMRVLDVGCDDAYALQQMQAPCRIGIDQHPRLPAPSDITIVRAAAEQLPLPNERFDVVCAFDVLEHISRDRAALHEMIRVLAPNGTLYFSTPSRDMRIVPWFLTPYTNRSFGHVRNGYTPEQIHDLFPQTPPCTLTYFFWNEPWLRWGFVLLHMVHQVAPALAAKLTYLCFQRDCQASHGIHGHLFGTIRVSS